MTMDQRRAVPLCWTSALAVLLVGSTFVISEAQQFRIQRGIMPHSADSSGEEPIPNVFVQPDRHVLQLLDKARQLLEQDRNTEAVRCLGMILDSPEDFFLKQDDAGSHQRSLKSEAHAILGQIPSQGRQMYEVQFGVRARNLLAESVSTGDVAGLAEVSRRFFHTQAGYEASLVLGFHHMDCGRPLAGALILEKLRHDSPIADRFEPTLSLALSTCWLRSGMREKAVESLTALKQGHPDTKVTISGKQFSLFDEKAVVSESLAQKPAWTALLEPLTDPGLRGALTRLVEMTASEADTSPERVVTEWAMFRGNPARNASTLGSEPLLNMRRWQSSTGDPQIEAKLNELSERSLDEERWSLPALHPLVVDDKVLMRSMQTLVAVDFLSGKRIWEVPVANRFEASWDLSPQAPFRTQDQLKEELSLRMWGDTTHGTLTSDGERVFAIEDLPLLFSDRNIRALLLNRLGRSIAQPTKATTRLAAYDVHSGKLVWEVGGSKEKLGLPLAGTCFLGPPLPLMNRLFVMADDEGKIRLFVLDSKTGKFLWSQQLALADQSISSVLLRRMAGVSPAYADGVLVCPTSEHAIVAIDLASRLLLWGYRFNPKKNIFKHDNLMALGLHRAVPLNPLLEDRWAKSDVILTEGRVLVTPIMSDHLHCLNLIDGKLLWKSTQKDNLYIASVYQGKVILIGKHHIRALNLQDGKPVASWEAAEVAFSAESGPSGQGFAIGNIYYIPMNSAEVLALDMDTGQVTSVSKSRRRSVPGNLVCSKGLVISQRVDTVEAFYQSEFLERQVAERLKANPNDAVALSLRGELLWSSNQLSDAIDCFDKSLEFDASPKTRGLLREAIFDGFRGDFATHRSRMDQVEAVLETPYDRSTFLRLVAKGHETMKEYEAAFSRYLELSDLDITYRKLEPIDEQLTVRSDRWLRMHLDSLQAAVSPEAREKFDQVIAERLVEATAANDSKALKRFLDIFGKHALADTARRELLDRWKKEGRLLEAELLLRRWQRSSDPTKAAAATVELAEMLQNISRSEDAAVCYERLRDQFADVVCRDGKTGRQWVDALPIDALVRIDLDRISPWPKGEVIVKLTEATGPQTLNVTQMKLEFHNDLWPFYHDQLMELSTNPFALIARDSMRRRRWQLPLAKFTGNITREPNISASNWMHLVAEGHLLLLNTGDKLHGVDTLVQSKDALPRILWTQDISDSLDKSVTRSSQGPIIMGGLRGRPFQQGLNFRNNQTMRPPHSVSDELVCFQQHRYCTAVEPLTGKVLWVRKGIKQPCTYFGDHEYLFVVPLESTEALVLRASDGKELGRRRVPSTWFKTIGRKILIWQRQSMGLNVLKLIDPWDGSRVWKPLPFSSNALVSIIDHRTIGVCEPKGRFVLIDLEDGSKRFDIKIDSDPLMSGFCMFPSPEGNVLVVMSAPKTENLSRPGVHPINHSGDYPIVQAKLYGLDPQGKMLWPAPVKVKDQYLLRTQAPRLPVIVFVCSKYLNPNKRESASTEILAVDRRNGRVVCNQRFQQTSDRVRMIADLKTKTVRLDGLQDAVTLTFTENPLPPLPVPSTKSKPLPPGPPKQSIYSILRRSVFGTPRKPNEPIIEGAKKATEEATEDATEEAIEEATEEATEEAIEELKKTINKLRENEIDPFEKETEER